MLKKSLLFFLGMAFLLLYSVSGYAVAQEMGRTYMCVEKSARVDIDCGKVSKWWIEDPEIAAVCKSGKKHCIIVGKKYGTTKLFYRIGKKKCVRYIVVDHPKLEKKATVSKGMTYSLVLSGIHKKSPVRCSVFGKSKPRFRVSMKPHRKIKDYYGCELYVRGIRKGSGLVIVRVSGKTVRCRVNVVHNCRTYVKKRVKKTKDYRKTEMYCSKCGKVLSVKKIFYTGLVDPEEDSEGRLLHGDIVIKDGCKVIPSGYCEGNQRITSLVIPSSVVTIEAFAFADCVNLQKVTIQGNGLKYIRYAAFNSCQPGLKEFPRLPDSVEVIEDHAFCHTNQAAFKNGSFSIPKNLKLLGQSELDWSGKWYSNPGNITTHVFYDTGGKSVSPLVSFTGESKNYIAVDGVLYRKDASGNPVFLIAMPSGKKMFDSFDCGEEKVQGIYVMPNTVTGAAELSLNNYNGALERVVFSDVFAISHRLTPLECAAYNCSMYVGAMEKGTPYANGVSIMGGYGNSNLTSYGVRKTNPKYREYEGCLFSKDYRVLWAVPPCIGRVVLHDETVKIDSGAMQQSFFGTPYNTNTGDGYAAWLKDQKAAALYAGERKMVSLSYKKGVFSLLEKTKSEMSVAERIVVHTIQTVLPNGNKKFVTEVRN